MIVNKKNTLNTTILQGKANQAWENYIASNNDNKLVCDFLVCSLILFLLQHNKHSWNISGVHGFLSLTVMWIPFRIVSCSHILTWHTKVLPVEILTGMLGHWDSLFKMDTKWWWLSHLPRTWASMVSSLAIMFTSKIETLEVQCSNLKL